VARTPSNNGFVYRVFIAAGVVVLVLLMVGFLGLLADVLLLTFAGILVAVVVDGVTRLVQRYLPLSRTPSLLAAFVLILLLAGGAGLLVVPQAIDQFPQLVERLPQAVQQLEQLVRQTPGAEKVIDGAGGDNGQLLDEDMLARIGGVFSTALGAIGSFLLILLIGFYLVLNPAGYTEQVLRLVPQQRRARLREVIATQGRALRLWLLSRLISMVFVGASTMIGLSLLGVPMAFTLGLLAGILTFIPYLGPILAAIPTGLVALLEGPRLALYAVLLYLAVETFEANVIFPLATQGVVHLPPAYTVIIQIAGGALAGLPGIIVATPLAVAAAVAVQMLYIEDTLGEPVEVLGGEDQEPP
jgi:predicted PurR-regulated permease PerM